MTPKLPVVSGKQCIKVLEQIGYEKVRQRGSHIRLKDTKGSRPSITVPDHKEIRPCKLCFLRKFSQKMSSICN